MLHHLSPNTRDDYFAHLFQVHFRVLVILTAHLDLQRRRGFVDFAIRHVNAPSGLDDVDEGHAVIEGQHLVVSDLEVREGRIAWTSRFRAEPSGIQHQSK
jgi:hypothetical protein